MLLTMNAKEMKLLDRFVGIVEDEAGLYSRMPAILQREKQAVAGADRGALCRICAEKEKLIALIQGLEEQRVEMLAKLADIVGGPRERLTLTRLSQRVAEPYASRIKATGERLSMLIRRIQDANQSNKGLIEHHLQLVAGAITFFERTQKPSQVYHRTGELRQVQQTGRVFSGKI
jgi:flagellar biosynthesis/type III secretory pathway chaperone